MSYQKEGRTESGWKVVDGKVIEKPGECCSDHGGTSSGFKLFVAEDIKDGRRKEP